MNNWTLMNYGELKKQIKKAVSELGTVLDLKGIVETTSALPLTGNKKGDVYIVSEDNTEYVWTSDNASGLITDYEALGPVVDGSFLPSVTESDAGKVLTVTTVAEKGTVIVPEQSVLLGGRNPVELTGVTGYPSDGDIVIVSVEADDFEVEYIVEVSRGTISFESASHNTDSIYESDGHYYIASDQPNNRGHQETIIVYAANKRTGWSADGSGLPTPTSNDIGKVAMVVGETRKGAVIAEEQSVTFDSKTKRGLINNVDTSLMTDGATLIITIDDVEYVVTYAEEPFDCGDYTISAYDDTTLEIMYNSLGTAEPAIVSINLANINAAWSANPLDSVLVVHDVDGTLDKTWREINDSPFSIVILDGGLILTQEGKGSEPMPPLTRTYTVSYFASFENGSISYECETADDYPSYVDGSFLPSRGVLVVHGDDHDTLDKTWQEIHDAIISNGAVINYGDAESSVSTSVISVSVESGVYYVVAGDGTSFSASSASGYPVLQS